MASHHPGQGTISSRHSLGLDNGMFRVRFTQKGGTPASGVHNAAASLLYSESCGPLCPTLGPAPDSFETALLYRRTATQRTLQGATHVLGRKPFNEPLGNSPVVFGPMQDFYTLAPV